MFGLSFGEVAVVLIVALLVLGPKRLPGVIKTLGKGLRELRRASNDLRATIEEPLAEIRQPLDEIREPLREIHKDLVDTVYGFEREVQRAAYAEDEKPAPSTSAAVAEQRQAAVEELYASYERDEPQDEAPATTEAAPSAAGRRSEV